MIKAATLLMALVASSVHSMSIGCALGAQCIATQGTKIPSSSVISMMDYCDDFTSNDIGRYVLKMSLQEILQKSGGRPMHPLNVANVAFDHLRESPLRFSRKAN